MQMFTDLNILLIAYYTVCIFSIWTVDLAYLLQKFSVRFTYCTVTLGANPDFSVERFYKVKHPFLLKIFFMWVNYLISELHWLDPEEYISIILMWSMILRKCQLFHPMFVERKTVRTRIGK